MNGLEQDRRTLEDLVVRFTDAFNRDDLDAVMAFMAEDAVYDQFNGRVARGTAAIRFHTEDLFVDAATGKALIRWLCTLDTGGERHGWRGLDVLHFADGRLKEKHTYAKADVPLIAPAPARP